MKYVFNDGGREQAGFKGAADDCVTRALAIATDIPYQDIYNRLALENSNQRNGGGKRRPKSARNGISTKRAWFKRYMRELGFTWYPTMRIGTGCQVHLQKEELPNGRLIVSVSRHYTAVLDGVIHDTHNPSRNGKRCVYGYWKR